MKLLEVISIILILTLCCLLVWACTIVSSPDAPVGRFQPVSANMALDTKTGQLCYSFDPLGQGSEKIPLCTKLREKGE